MPGTSNPAKPTFEELRRDAAEVFIHGFPLLLMDEVRRSHPFVTSRFRRLPSKVADLARGLRLDDPCVLLTSALIDLSEGPAVLHVPDIDDRYFSLTLVDAAGEPFASFGTRNRDYVSPDVVLVGPRWRGNLPGPAPVRRAPSDVVWVVSRIVGHSPADMTKAEALAALQHVVAQRRPARAESAATLLSLELADLPSTEQIAELSPTIALHRLRHLIDRAPRPARNRLVPAIGDQLERLAALAGREEQSGVAAQAMSQGFSDGFLSIQHAARELPCIEACGWRATGRARMSDPLMRAANAERLLGAPLPADGVALSCVVDEAGRPLTGEESYRICFGPDAFAPRAGAWRLTTTPLSGGEVCGAIGPHMDLTFDRNGALDLIVQQEPSPNPQRLNWLPSPPGPFRLTMQLFWPATRDWRMAPVERLGSRLVERSQPLNRPKPPPARRRERGVNLERSP